MLRDRRQVRRLKEEAFAEAEKETDPTIKRLFQDLGINLDHLDYRLERAGEPLRALEEVLAPVGRVLDLTKTPKPRRLPPARPSIAEAARELSNQLTPHPQFIAANPSDDDNTIMVMFDRRRPLTTDPDASMPRTWEPRDTFQGYPIEVKDIRSGI